MSDLPPTPMTEALGLDLDALEAVARGMNTYGSPFTPDVILKLIAAARSEARPQQEAVGEWKGVSLRTERRGAGAFVIVDMERADGSTIEAIREFADITDTIISHWTNLNALSKAQRDGGQ